MRQQGPLYCKQWLEMEQRHSRGPWESECRLSPPPLTRSSSALKKKCKRESLATAGRERILPVCKHAGTNWGLLEGGSLNVWKRDMHIAKDRSQKHYAPPAFPHSNSKQLSRAVPVTSSIVAVGAGRGQESFPFQGVP